VCPLELTLQLTQAAMSFFAVRDTPPPATPLQLFSGVPQYPIHWNLDKQAPDS